MESGRTTFWPQFCLSLAERHWAGLRFPGSLFSSAKQLHQTNICKTTTAVVDLLIFRTRKMNSYIGDQEIDWKTQICSGGSRAGGQSLAGFSFLSQRQPLKPAMDTRLHGTAWPSGAHSPTSSHSQSASGPPLPSGLARRTFTGH